MEVTAAAGSAHRPGLDGLRGVAVVLVVVHHLHPDLLPGGFLGVDVFFALSGYLITSLLLGELGRDGRVALRAFWVRRARRLLPALYLTLAGVAVASRWWLPSWQWDDVRADGVAALLYVSNWRFIVDGQQYFDTAGAPSPLLHLWSLAIEEQAYVLWPLAVAAAHRWWGRRGITAVAVGLAALSAGAMAVLGPGNTAYLATHTRAQAILIGAVAATWVPLHRRASAASGALVAGAAASALVLGTLVVVADGSEAWMYRGGFTLAAVAATVLAVAATAPGPVARMLAVAPLRVVGIASYGIYLFHWPVIVFATEGRTGLSGWALDAVRVGLVALIATVSYRWLEQPIRRGRVTPATRRLLPAGVAVVVALVLAVGIGATAPPSYLAPTDAVEDAAATTVAPLPPTTVPAPTSAPITGEPGTSAPPTTAPPPPPVRRITVVGDSVLASLAPGLRAAAEARGIEVVDRTAPGCGVATNTVPASRDGEAISFTSECREGIGSIQAAAVADGSDVVLVHSTWEAGDRLADDGTHLVPGTAAWAHSVEEGMAQALARLGANGARTILLVPAPNVIGVVRTADATTNQQIVDFGELLRDLAADRSLRAVDLGPIVCDGRPDDCPEELDGVRIRPDDGGHFSPEGAALVGPLVLEEVLALP